MIRTLPKRSLCERAWARDRRSGWQLAARARASCLLLTHTIAGAPEANLLGLAAQSFAGPIDLASEGYRQETFVIVRPSAGRVAWRRGLSGGQSRAASLFQ
jgi:hypothetical protein